MLKIPQAKTREEKLSGWLRLGEAFIREAFKSHSEFWREAMLREFPELEKYTR